MESEAVLVPCALGLLHCLVQIPSFTAAPSPEERCGFPPCFSSSAIFVLPPPCPPHPKEEKLHPEEGDVRGQPTGC